MTDLMDIDKLMALMLKNPDFVDDFVDKKVPKETVTSWGKKKEQKPQKPSPGYHLKYLSVEYKKAENTKAHQTASYVNNDLVLRRAAQFNIELKFKNRVFDPKIDKIILELAIGNSPAETSNTKVRMTPGKQINKEEWGCQMQGQNEADKTVSFVINIPKDAIVGRTQLTAEVTTKADEGTTTRRYLLPDLLIIFNPFSEDDDVYMADEQQRKEYVMNEQGLIWGGSYKKLQKMTWTFGQFEKDILDIVFKLINTDTSMKANPIRSLKQHNSPVFVTRVLSAMINHNDDKGVLIGDWSGDYTGGTNPSSWSGSAKILRQWNKSGPVKYGQCWVYSGVFTTALRAIGIPARSITNFQSAHDTEYNMSLDKFFYADGSHCSEQLSKDSIWSFHVWNDCWMKRPDIGKEYDGWQAVDGTPQEKSGKIYQCGPAPLPAIKAGDVNIGYETDFIFGEVNSDECKYLVNENDKIVKMIGRDTGKCGKSISTKAPGSNERLDITHLYKYKEGTTEERAAFTKAQLRGRAPDWQKHILIQKEGPITIEITAAENKLVTGQRVPFEIKVVNTTDAQQECKITTRIESMLYTGKRKSGIKEVENSKILAAKETFSYKFEASFAEYGFVLSANRIIRCVVSVRNTNTDQVYIDTTNTVLKHPKVVVLTPPTSAIKAGGKFDIGYKITNSFPVSLSNCVLNVEGLGVDSEVKINNPIVPNGEICGVISTTALRAGKIQLMANLESRQVVSIKAKTSIQVE